MERKEMIALAKENGVAKAHQTKTVVLEEILTKMGLLGVQVENRGRKVDPTSARQIRLAAMAAKKESGEFGLGRPVDLTSERQIRLAAQAAKAKANGGELKRGREIDPTSARQIALAEKQAKLDAGIVIKRGRPAKVVEVSEEKAAK